MPDTKPVSNVAPKPKNAVANYISETIAELKKVIWLSRRDLLYLSGIVLLVTLVVGVILGSIDFGFSKFIQWLITAVKGV
jgi:preprotein translocase subunit SecE